MWPGTRLGIDPDDRLHDQLVQLHSIDQMVPWVAVVELMLQRALHVAPSWPQGFRWDEDWVQMVWNEVARAIEGALGREVDRDTVSRLLMALEATLDRDDHDRNPEVREAVFGHTLAQELDKQGLASMSSVVPLRRYRLRQGRLAPRLRADTHIAGAVDVGMNTPPEDVDYPQITRTPNYYLAGEEVISPGFVIDYSVAAGLRFLKKPSAAAVVLPATSMDDIDWVTFTGDDGGTEHVVFGLTDAAMARAGRLASRAMDHDPSILLLPEYCSMSGDDFRRVRDALAGEGSLSLAVLGTALACGCTKEQYEDHTHTATALLQLSIGRTVQQVKLQPAAARIPLQNDDEGEEEEWVRSVEAVGAGHDDVVVLADPSGSSVVVLICRDAFSAQIVNVLRDLGVGYVLVPMMSRPVTSVEQRLTGLASDSQSIGVIANAPHTWMGNYDEDRALAALFGPYRNDGAENRVVRESDVEGAGLAMFDMSQGTLVDWHPDH